MLFLLASLLLATYAEPSSIAFYINSADGSDANSGSTPDTAWGSLVAASERISAALDASPTSRIDVWIARDSQFLSEGLVIASSMFVGNVTVAAFGNTSLPRPLVQHARGLTDIGSTPCVRIDVPMAFSTSVSGLRLSGCSTGISISGSSGQNPPTSNIVLADNILTDIQTSFLRYTPPNPHWATAILLAGGNMANVTIQNNVGARIDVFFQSTSHVDSLLLDANTVQMCSGNCYSMGSGNGLVLRNSVFLRDNSNRLFSYGTTDVIIGTVAGPNAVINNDFLQRGVSQRPKYLKRLGTH